jgi:hypothetical protein
LPGAIRSLLQSSNSSATELTNRSSHSMRQNLDQSVCRQSLFRHFRIHSQRVRQIVGAAGDVCAASRAGARASPQWLRTQGPTAALALIRTHPPNATAKSTEGRRRGHGKINFAWPLNIEFQQGHVSHDFAVVSMQARLTTETDRDERSSPSRVTPLQTDGECRCCANAGQREEYRRSFFGPDRPAARRMGGVDGSSFRNLASPFQFVVSPSTGVPY